jgi:hypothetical protein
MDVDKRIRLMTRKRSNKRSEPASDGHGVQNPVTEEFMPGYAEFKDWLLDRTWPAEFGNDKQTRLKNRLEAEGFTKIRVEPDRHHPIFTVRMSRGTYANDLLPRSLKALIHRVAADIGMKCQPPEMVIAVRDDRIRAAFILLGLNEELPERRIEDLNPRDEDDE